MSVNEKMTAIADNIRRFTGGTEPLTLDGMATKIAEVNDMGYTMGYGEGCSDGYDSGHIDGYNSRNEDVAALETQVTSLETEKAQLELDVDTLETDISNINNAFSAKGVDTAGVPSTEYEPLLDEVVDEWAKGYRTKTVWYYAFGQCGTMTRIPKLNTSKGTNFNTCFYSCQIIKSVPPLDTSNGTDFGNMFKQCFLLETVEGINITKATQCSGMFSECSKLHTVIFNGSIPISISLSDSPLFDPDCVRNNITPCLVDYSGTETTQTLTLHADVTAQLTESDIAAITEKGWTLA